MSARKSKKGTKRRMKTAREFFENFTMTKKQRRNLWISFGIGVILIVAGIILDIFGSYLFSFFLAPGLILFVIPPALFFVIPDKRVTVRIVVVLAFVVLGILLKIYRIGGAGIVLTFALLTMAIGYFFLIFKNYYAVKESKYLRIVSTIAASFLTLMSTGMIFKMMHWPGSGLLLKLSLMPSLIFTLIVLITLPGSGFIKWTREGKLMFTRKLLIPWMFFLLFSGFAFLLPKGTADKIFYPGITNVKTNFNMEAYEIEQAEGLEP